MSRRSRNGGAAILAGALGIALNFWRVSGPEGFVRLISGRMVTLPITILLGPWYGLLAAVVGILPRAYANPTTLLTGGVEAVAIGLLVQRGIPPVVTGALVSLSWDVVFHNLSAKGLCDAARAIEECGAGGQLDGIDELWRRVSVEAAAVMDILRQSAALQEVA